MLSSVVAVVVIPLPCLTLHYHRPRHEKARAQGGFVVVAVVAVVVVVIPLPGLTLSYLRPRRVKAGAQADFVVVAVVAVVVVSMSR